MGRRRGTRDGQGGAEGGRHLTHQVSPFVYGQAHALARDLALWATGDGQELPRQGRGD